MPHLLATSASPLLMHRRNAAFLSNHLALLSTFVLLSATLAEAQPVPAARAPSITRDYAGLIIVIVALAGTLFGAYVKARLEARDFEKDFNKHLLRKETIESLKNHGKFVTRDRAELADAALLGGLVTTADLAELSAKLKKLEETQLETLIRIELLEAATDDPAVRDGLLREAGRRAAVLNALKRHNDR